MSAIADVIAGLRPLDGAVEFLDHLRTQTQVILLSDTFAEFARPLMGQLGWPTIFCHNLVVADDRIVDYRLRMADQKRHSVIAFQGLGYRVAAAGDSYNDTSMLLAADAGFLFHAPANVHAEFPQLPAFDDYTELTDRSPHRPRATRESDNRSVPPVARIGTRSERSGVRWLTAGTRTRDGASECTCD